MRITIEQIRTFDCILRLGSFHAAARHLGLTQPTVSQRIRELEQAIGAPLFIRQGPRIRPTGDAEELRLYALRMLGLAEEMAQRFGRRDPLRGTLRLGTTDSFAQLCMVELMGRLERIHPDLKVSVCVDNSQVISRLLEERGLDIAVVSEPNVSPRFRQETVGANVLAWVASAALDLPLDMVDAATLAQRHLVITPPPSLLHDTVLRWFAEEELVPLRLSTCNNLAVILRLVLGTGAIGVVPVSIIRKELARGELRLVATPRGLRPHRVSICYERLSQDRGLPRIAELIREVIGEMALFREMP